MDDVVRKYEGWLAQLHTPRYGMGVSRSPQEVVFITDLRAEPDRGLSKVHIKIAPEGGSVYGRQRRP
jgi:hypothetical protein